MAQSSEKKEQQPQPKTKQVIFLQKIQQNLFYDLFGPKILPMRYIINLFKGATFLWVYFLIQYFQNTSPTLNLYLYLHGSYGIFWIIKDLTFPDQRFMKQASVGSAFLCFLLLTLYWTIPIPLAMETQHEELSSMRKYALIGLYVVGLILMLGSDLQKYIVLQRKKGLIHHGFFATTRNPNYLGQILIYSSFVLCSNHLIGYIVVYGLACPLFALNMYLKDKLSLSKKRMWKTYERNSYLLLPKLFNNYIANLILYLVVLVPVAYILFKKAQIAQTALQL